MGWGAGTEIFDTVAKSCDKMGVSVFKTTHIMTDLLEVLEDKDWDTLDECEHPIARSVINKVHPGYFEEE